MNSNSSPIFTFTDSLSRMAKPQPPWKPSNICCLRSEGFLLFTGYCLPSLFNNCLMRQSPLCPGEWQPSTLVFQEQCTISLGTDYRVGFKDKGSTLCCYLNSTTCGNLLQTLLNSRFKLCLTHRPEGWCTSAKSTRTKQTAPQTRPFWAKCLERNSSIHQQLRPAITTEENSPVCSSQYTLGLRPQGDSCEVHSGTERKGGVSAVCLDRTQRKPF